MADVAAHNQVEVAYELRFADPFHVGGDYTFPCDVNGRVDIDMLDNATRLTYLYARAMEGRELSAPVTCLREARRRC